MGRFYSTTSFQPVDFIYQLPAKMMAETMQAVETRNDELNNSLNLLDDSLAKIQYLEPDKQRVKQIVNEYQNKINSLVENISSNPTEWRKYSSDVKNLGKELANNYTKGELAAIQGNYSAYQNWLKEDNERFKKGDITSEWLSSAKNKYLSEFNGTNYDNNLGAYNSIKTEALAKHVDLNKKFDDYLKDVKANSTDVKNTTIGTQWLIKTENGNEWVDEARLAQIAANKLSADDETKAFIRQGANLGIFKDPAKVIENVMQGAIKTHAYSKTKSVKDYDPNQIWIHNDSEAQQNARQQRSFDHAQQMENLRTENDIRAAKIKHNLDNVKGLVSLDDNNDTNNFNTTTSITQQLFTPEELNVNHLNNNIIPSLDSQIKDLDSRINTAINKGDNNLAIQLREQKQLTQLQKNTAKGIVNNAMNDYYNSNHFKTLPEETKQDIRGYRQYIAMKGLEDTREQRLKYLDALDKNPILDMPGAAASNVQSKLLNVAERYLPNSYFDKRIKNFLNAADKVDNTINEFAKKNSSANQYDIRGINVSLNDPTITGVLNKVLLNGKVMTQNPEMFETGNGRTNKKYKQDIGNRFGFNNDEGEFNINELMKATGASTPTELMNSITLLPSNNGNLRMMVQLKSQSPDGKTIGSSPSNYYQIEGLKDNKVVLEVKGTGLEQSIYTKFNNDRNPAVQNLSYSLTNLDNLNFSNKFANTLKNVNSSNPDGFGPENSFSYGDITYKISKAKNGNVKVVVDKNGEVKDFVFPNDIQAQSAVLDYHHLLQSNQ